MKRYLSISSFIFLVAVSSAGASSSPVFDEIMKPYENIRQTLIDDTLDGVADEAQVIRLAARENSVGSESEEIRELLPWIAEHAEALAESTELGTAREAFYEMSKVLVRYRSKITGERPQVIYCSMARKSWLQPAGAIGNPYHGRSMEKCGEVVEK